MRRQILLCLMAGALPFLAAAKDDAAIPAVKKGLHFRENKGQVTDQYHQPRTDVQFSIGSNGMMVFIGEGQLHYQFSHATVKPHFTMASKDAFAKPEPFTTDMYRMDVELLGANKHAQVIAEEKQEFVEHFYESSHSGKNTKGVLIKDITAMSYDKITYKNIYPNIDWVLYSKDNQLEYEFVVRPGGNPANIKLKYGGETGLKINADGSLTATTPMGTVSEKAPSSFQADGRKVSSSFKLNGDVLSFELGNYTGTLTIDPLINWGTYWGYTDVEEYKGIAYDGVGNIYMVGYTASLTGIATVGAYQTANAGGNYDIFVTKLTAAGAIGWSTYLGALSEDVGWGIHSNGTDVVICGYTDVLGDVDLVIGSFSSTGAYIYDYIYGDVGEDIGYNITRNSANESYMACRTTSTIGMSTVGQTVFGGGTYDALLVKFNTAGAPLWGTYLGGTGDESMVAVSCDNSGNIYGGGWTSSSNAIGTTGVTQQFLSGGYDGYIAKYNSAGTKLWGTYWGGTTDDNILGLTCDGNGNTYVTGMATSSGLASTGAYQTTMNGLEDVIVGKYNTNGIKQWGTYLGGPGYDEGYDVALTTGGAVLVCGATQSSSTLATTNSNDQILDGTNDGFMSKFTTTGAIEWSQYYGGNANDALISIASDNATYFYVAGWSESTTGVAYNTTIQTNNLGFADALVAKFLDCFNPAQPGTITGTTPVCAGSSQTYSIAAVTGATSYTWTFPSGWAGSSNTTSATVTAGTTGGTISVSASNACGTSTVQTMNVVVTPLPTATANAAGPTTFCQGGSVVINGGTGTSYQWYNGTTLISGATSASYTATTSGSYNVVVTSNGCSATSASVTVTVNPLPATPTATNTGPVCAGQPLTLNGSTTTTGVTYNWTGPNNYPNTQNPFIATTVAGDAGTYTLTVVDGNNCQATATTTVVISAGIPATPSAITGPTSVCAGSSNTYSVTNDVNASQYNWTLPSGWTGTSTTNSINATASTTSGNISVTAQNGCGTSAASTLAVTVNPLPTPTIIQAGGDLTTTTTYTTYQWYNSSGPISGATSQTYTPTANGTYHVVVTDANGCSNSSNNLTFSTSVKGVNQGAEINLYPNPNTGSFSINGVFHSNDGKVNIAIVDIAGRIVHKETVTIKGNAISATVNMNASFAPGMYTLKLNSDVETTVVPFVKK